MKLLPHSPQYSDLSIFRILCGGVCAAILGPLLSGGSSILILVFALAAIWLVGLLFRLIDMRRYGMSLDRTVIMNRGSWMLDISLRGYFRGRSKEPIVS